MRPLAPFALTLLCLSSVAAATAAPRAIDFAEAGRPPAGMVVLPVGKDGALEGIAAAIDAAAQGALAEAIKLAKFKGEPGQTLTLYGVGPHPAVLLIGTGATLKSAVDLRTFGALAAKGTAGWPTDAQVVVPDARDVEHDAAEAALGARLGEYDFGKWGAPAAAGATSQRGSGLTFLAPRAAASKAAFRTEGEAVFEGVAFARDLISTPSNIKSPEWFAGEVRRKFQGVAKTTVTVLDERQIQALGMGALYGTGQGSTRPPRRRPVRSSRWRAVTPR